MPIHTPQNYHTTSIFPNLFSLGGANIAKNPSQNPQNSRKSTPSVKKKWQHCQNFFTESTNPSNSTKNSHPCEEFLATLPKFLRRIHKIHKNSHFCEEKVATLPKILHRVHKIRYLYDVKVATDNKPRAKEAPLHLAKVRRKTVEPTLTKNSSQGTIMQIKREFYLQQLIDGKQNGLIKIVTGIRRCGKSYLLFKLFTQHLLRSGVDHDHIIQIALDDIERADLREPLSLYRYIKAKMTDDELYYIILDEVQLVSRFEEVLNSLLRIDNADVYVTGSNSKFLSSDIITEFRGRGDEIRLYPLSLAEYCEGTGLSPIEAWNDYFTYGGLPHVLSLETEKKKLDYLNNLFESVYLIDIIERQHIKNTAEFEELVKIIASGIGAPTNPTKLANTFKSVKKINIGSTTIDRYLSYMQDAFIIEKAERYDVKGKKYIGSLAKYYFSDLGLRNAILGLRQQEESHIMENIIYNELRRRGCKVDVGTIEQRLVDDNGKWQRKQLEVDFVVNEGNQRYYIQSALAMPDEEKRKQEMGSLLRINDSFRKIIVVKDNIKPWHDENGILTIGLIDFLMNPSSIEQ